MTKLRRRKQGKGERMLQGAGAGGQAKTRGFTTGWWA
jgi:hypothetical protein